MPSNLPADFIKRARELLTPRMTTVAKRKGYLMEAFYTADRRLYHAIPLEGDAKEFSLTCIGELLDRGCLPSRKHPLGLLFGAVQVDCGDADAREAADLIDLLQTECEERPTVTPMKTPSTPVIAPVQPTITIDTKPEYRRPTVFLSYSRTDAAQVEKLRESLTAAGHVCWIDTETMKGGDIWLRAIAEGINNSYAFVAVTSKNALNSQWCRKELLWANQEGKLIIPVLLEDCTRQHGFLSLIDYNPIHFYKDAVNGMRLLVNSVGAPPVVSATPPITLDPAADRALRQRAQELEYLSRLNLENWLQTIHRAEEYTSLAGVAQVSAYIDTRYQRQMRAITGKEAEQTREISREQRPVTDIVTAIREMRRAVLLGEPGEGKSTTLWKIAQDFYEAAQKSPSAPIPILVRLGKWDKPDQLLEDFIRAELGGLGEFLGDLLTQKRAALLLDGLNEIQLSQRQSGKDDQVKDFLKANPDLLSVVSCRVRDYTHDLGFDTLQITPLDPERILDFATRYLDPIKGAGVGEAMFWKLCGGEAVREVWRTWQRAGATFDLFFTATDIPDGIRWISSQEDQLWREKIRSPGSLLTLASNAYMLTMMTSLYRDNGRLPDNRAELFTDFVDKLIDREIGKREQPRNPRMLVREADLRMALPQLANEMQIRRSPNAEERNSAATTLPVEQVKAEFMDDELLYLASSASLLDVGEAVRFSHQLLQEYFVAWHMFGEIKAGRLKAEFIWNKATWWEPTGWEEATILLVGMFPAQLDWVLDANTEVAAQCIVRSGATILPELLKRCQDRWLSRLTDLKGDPDARARAAVGRALGLTDLDTRPGVGLRTDGVPDIAWCEVAGGVYNLGSDEDSNNKKHTVTLSDFQIGKYPITYRQFQAFIDAPDGYQNATWWDGLYESGKAQQQEGPGDQSFKFWNHPREGVSWYAAVAFCRWLSARLGFEVRLPTDDEWEAAARGMAERRYPYGTAFDPTKGNTRESGIGQTSAVGIYLEGASPCRALDMSGNVWEWTLTEYSSRKSDDLANAERRTLRGGSWFNTSVSARGVSRQRPRSAQSWQQPRFSGLRGWGVPLLVSLIPDRGGAASAAGA